MPLSELPDIDAVVISHDHYDHLDMGTVRALAACNVRFVVPLGIGARFGPFGVAMIEIGEYDARWADVHLGPGGMVEPGVTTTGRWWPNVEWRSVEQAPAYSTSVNELWKRTAPGVKQ